MRPELAAAHVAAICNAAWWVRWWGRPHQRDKRAGALRELGLVARAAFNSTEDFAPLLYAIARTMPREDLGGD
jgi:hypothetical protein